MTALDGLVRTPDHLEVLILAVAQLACWHSSRADAAVIANVFFLYFNFFI